mmetsp:Transcript_54398/g.118343  ORF Transcript_54398/g.118343 Transcript_54398/m.118343 type:complete len:86 (+) Transcript_54398:116-373(+)
MGTMVVDAVDESLSRFKRPRSKFQCTKTRCEAAQFVSGRVLAESRIIKQCAKAAQSWCGSQTAFSQTARKRLRETPKDSRSRVMR